MTRKAGSGNDPVPEPSILAIGRSEGEMSFDHSTLNSQSVYPDTDDHIELEESNIQDWLRLSLLSEWHARNL